MAAMKKYSSVEEYLKGAPKQARGKLIEMRKIIRQAAPDSTEDISYGMPGYDKGKVAWFGLFKNHISLFLRPPIIAEHAIELAGYTTTKSAVHFPLDKKLPLALIRKLVKARIEKNKLPKR